MQTIESKVSVAGNDYTVWHVGGKIVATACQGRWPRTPMATGDVWLDAQLLKGISESEQKYHTV